MQLPNNKWPEVVKCLRDRQTAEHRFDIISRVFHLKVAELMKDLREGVLGKHVGHIYCVEWQKRGLPHVHILIFFVPEDKLTTPEDYDEVVCAEIPDPDAEPELHKLVMQLMIHGPCVGHDTTNPSPPDRASRSPFALCPVGVKSDETCAEPATL